MLFAYEFINGRESPARVIEFVTTIKDLINTELQLCGYTKTIRDLEEFCHMHSDKHKPHVEHQEEAEFESRYPYHKIKGEVCSKREMTRSFYRRGFTMIAAYNKVSLIIENFPRHENHEIYMQSLNLGWQIGKVIRILYQFEQE